MPTLQHGANVTVCNNRMDTPLHNAARWNHPLLVNELLHYGASYTATNRANRTPSDLSSDEPVQELFWKASHGVIAVGSYSPLARRRADTTPRLLEGGSERTKNVALGNRGGVQKGAGRGGAGAAASAKQGVPPTAVVRGGDQKSKALPRPKSYAGPPPTRKVGGGRGFDLFDEDLYVVIDEEAVVENQLGGSQGEGQGEELANIGGGSGVLPPPAVQVEEGDSDEEHRSLPPAKEVELQEVELKEEEEEKFLPPKKDDKLISLLQAIEAFDR